MRQRFFLAGIFSLAWVFITPLVAFESALWRSFVSDSAAGKTNILPDFSHTGYRHGEKPIPDLVGPVFKVQDFGAKPDDGISDAVAVQKAIDACQRAGGGVVLFSRGVFIINDDFDSATNARIRIRESGVVLRGAGSGPEGTVLYSPVEMQPEDPAKMWTGRSPVMIAPLRPMFGSKKARVRAPSWMGSFRLELADGHGFKSGDRLVVRTARRGTKAASFIAPREWQSEWAGVNIRELHQVTSVESNSVRLAEPLMISLDAQDDWSVQEIFFISNIGVEDLCFRGNWKESFFHHKDWRNDSAWRGISMVGVEESWLRRCVFEDFNWAVHIMESRQVTVESVDMIGTPAHFGMQATGTYGVLAVKVRDLAGHHHGPSLQSGSCATVYHQCVWNPRTSFDSHGNNPYATLHDLNLGGLNLSGVGGALRNFPHHLHGLIFWNLEVPSNPQRLVNFWTVGAAGYPVAFSQVIFAGVHGVEPEFEDSSLSVNESPGKRVSPRSLWLAQLERRLGNLPEQWKGL